MTRLSRRKSNRGQCLVLMLVVCLLVGWRIGKVNAKEAVMKTKEMTLRQMVEALAGQIPFTKNKVELLLSANPRETSRNQYMVFFSGGNVLLAEGILITAIDLRLRCEAGGSHGFMSLGIGGRCISLGEVRGRFDSLEIAGAPHGRSLDEKTYHAARLPWGELSFGFTERNPDCLALIVFDPTKVE